MNIDFSLKLSSFKSKAASKIIGHAEIELAMKILLGCPHRQTFSKILH